MGWLKYTPKMEAIDTINDILTGELGEQPLTDKQVEQFGIQGGESTDKLREWACDYSSELQTQRAEAAKGTQK